MDSLAFRLMALIGTLLTLIFQVEAANANEAVVVSCEVSSESPAVVATLSNRGVSQTTPILSFWPKYFSPTEAASLCQSTASKLDTFYAEGRMNYLASDTVEGKPVVCAVERRGLNCDSYGSDVLFSLDEAINPTELLYSMLNDNFKGPRLPSSRTVSRIYSDLRPSWWPFE